MTVKLLLSKPAGGRTSFCMEKIREIRKKDPLAPVKVIVPDRMQMAYWKQTLSRGSGTAGGESGFIGTEIISFAKLAMGILNGSDNTPRVIPPRLDSLCLREAIKNASRKKPLQYFDPIREKPGLLSLFEDTIHALLHACVTPEQLEEAAGKDPKAADTARIFREYLAILGKNNWIGAAGLLSAAADALLREPDLFSRRPLLVLDGFNELTKDFRYFLRVLSPFCDEILITLPANPDAFEPTDRRIMDHARLICSELNAEWILPEHFEQHSEILQLTDHVFYPAADSGKGKMTLGNDAFLMIEASSRTTEVREALRELKRRIVESEKHSDSRIRPNECVVFVPDMQAYAPILRQFGREMGIPLRFSRKQTLAESPAASALKRLLRLYPDFETVKLLSVLRLPFLAGCPDPEDPSGGNYGADLFVIDRIGRKMNIISGTEEWASAFAEVEKTALKGKSPDDDAGSSDDGKVYEYPEEGKLKRIYDSFERFTKLVTPPVGLHPRSEWIRWLENLLKTIRFYEQIEDPKGRSFESDLMSLLRRIVFCEEVLDQSAVTYEEFLSELETEMDAAEQTEQEYAADRIFVGDIGQTSGCRWKLIVLLGFAEGVFPRPEHEDLILTNDLRKKLDIPFAVDQQLLFHHALTRSDTGLVITRPTKTDKGEEWPASIFWLTICKNLAEDANLLTVSENMPITAASLDEMAFRLARAGRKEVTGEITFADPAKLQTLLDRAWDERESLQKQTEGKYSPDIDPALKEAISAPGKDAVPYSCSAIETWLTCPFKYFLMRKLRLEQPIRPGTGMDAAQIGNLNHKVMELTFAPGTVYASEAEALEKADKVIDSVLAEAPKEFGFRESELWEYEKEKYRQKLLESIKKMFASPKMPMNSRWMSVGAELKFGYPEEGEDSAEPLTVETESGPIRIRGIIDRVDRRDDGLLRVVDYKTGASGFTKEELAAGSHIQAGVYAAAVVHALRMGPKCEGMYWSINNKSVKDHMEYDSQEEAELPKLSFLNRFAKGIEDAAFPAEPAGGTCPDYCPAASWCKKYGRREFYG